MKKKDAIKDERTIVAPLEPLSLKTFSMAAYIEAPAKNNATSNIDFTSVSIESWRATVAVRNGSI
jgi:hypothetical protein